MNDIIYAGSDFNVKRSGNFEILVCSQNGEIIVVPPLADFNFNKKSGIRITLERATLPFKEVRIFQDDFLGGITHAANQGVYYFNLKQQKCEGVLSSLGELIASYLILLGNNRKYSPVVENLKNDILKGVSDSMFSLKDTIRKLPLNYDYVRKLFQKEVGITPQEFLFGERMKLAQSIILSRLSNKYSEYSVSQIAESCGFSDPLYFSRVFKKYFGVSPGNYNKN